MMHLSMPTYSIRGKVTKTFIRVKIPEHFNPVASYVKYFEVPEEMQGKRLFISFRETVTLHYGCNGQFVGYSDNILYTVRI